VIRLLWDASAWVKRYYFEIGTGAAVELGNSSPYCENVLTVVGYAETHSILVRRRNGGHLSAEDYRDAAAKLVAEVLQDPAVTVLDVVSQDVLDGIVLIRRHSLNSSDASILQVYRALAAEDRNPCVLVAADHRLCRAAALEGLRTLNRETISPLELNGLLGGQA
jgi:predicted nucleic acid-binding protein